MKSNMPVDTWLQLGLQRKSCPVPCSFSTNVIDFLTSRPVSTANLWRGAVKTGNRQPIG